MLLWLLCEFSVGVVFYVVLFVGLILSNCAVDRYGKIGLAFPIIRGSITDR